MRKHPPHRIEPLANEGTARLFNQFEDAKNGCGG